MKRLNLQLMNSEYAALKVQARAAGILPGTLARLFLQAGILTENLDNRKILFDAKDKNFADTHGIERVRHDPRRFKTIPKKR
jgi:hypothetical protein